MHFFVMHVLSNTAAKERYPKGYSEAHVSCWINDPSSENALKKAIALIRASGWSIAEIIDNYPISRENYSLKPEGLECYEETPIDGDKRESSPINDERTGLEYYEQALVDGEVLVFFVSKQRSDSQQN
jgi:hypothetical protein